MEKFLKKQNMESLIPGSTKGITPGTPVKVSPGPVLGGKQMWGVGDRAFNFLERFYGGPTPTKAEWAAKRPEAWKKMRQALGNKRFGQFVKYMQEAQMQGYPRYDDILEEGTREIYAVERLLMDLGNLWPVK